MKQLFFKIYSAFFALFRIFPINEKKLVFISMHNANFNDGLGYVERAFALKDGSFNIQHITRKDLELDTSNGAVNLIKSVFRAIRFFTVKAYHLATARYVFLNDNFMPMATLNFSEKTVITQLWHAEGAFKRFGQDIDQPPEIRSREIAGNAKLTYVVCSSKKVAPIYASAFGIDENRVLPLGSPRTDYFFEEHDVKSLREKFESDYPECKGKKLVLYAPTFRDDEERDKQLLENLDVNYFTEKLGDEYALLVRLHPQVHLGKRPSDGTVDVTDYPNVNELVLLSDILITDYSSIAMDFALVRKPMLFFAFDLEYYENSRAFYEDYETYVPGKIVKTGKELVDSIAQKDFEQEKTEKFRTYNFDTPDGHASERVTEYLLTH